MHLESPLIERVVRQLKARSSQQHGESNLSLQGSSQLPPPLAKTEPSAHPRAPESSSPPESHNVSESSRPPESMGAILNSPFIAPCTVAEEQILLRRFFPFAELLYLIAVQDGAIDEREVEVAFGALHALTHGRISFSVYQDLARELRRRLNRDGLDARLDAICAQLSLDPADAELAFTLAVAMSWADESLSEDEGALLAELGSWLGLSARAQAQVLKGSRRSKPPSLPSSAT